MNQNTATTLNEAAELPPVGVNMKIAALTRTEGFYRVPSSGQDVFQVAPGLHPYQALEFAENALIVCRSLLYEIGNGNGRDEDIAFAARFLIEAAGGAYRAAGIAA